MEAHDNKQKKLIGCGSVTDGTFKLEVHIINFINEEYSKMGINKGDKIEIIGVVQTTSNIFNNKTSIIFNNKTWNFNRNINILKIKITYIIFKI